MIFKSNKKPSPDDSQDSQSNTDAETEAEQTVSSESSSNGASNGANAADEQQSAISEADLEQAKRNLQASKLLAARFGEIVGLLMCSPGYKHYSLADLEWMIVPPLLNNQIIIAEARSEEKGLSVPVGIGLWARVADDIHAKLSKELDRPVRLHPSEWKSGDNLWLIDVVGPPQIIQGMMAQLGSSVFEGKSFNVRHRDKDGKRSIRTIDPQKAVEENAGERVKDSSSV